MSNIREVVNCSVFMKIYFSKITLKTEMIMILYERKKVRKKTASSYFYSINNWMNIHEDVKSSSRYVV